MRWPSDLRLDGCCRRRRLRIIATLLGSRSVREDKEQLMSVRDEWTVEEALGAFDEHLRRARGLCSGTRGNYARYTGEFLWAVFPAGRVDVDQIRVGDVIAFVGAATRRYQPRTVELAATSLRSFFRFLRAAGLRGDRLEDWVPMVPHRRSGLVRHLDRSSFERLIASLDSSSPRRMRDRAIILCIARLGLRASEVVQLQLQDIDWRNATVRVRARKTGHGALLPLPGEVGAALHRAADRRGTGADLRRCRPGRRHPHHPGRETRPDAADPAAPHRPAADATLRSRAAAPLRAARKR